MKYQFRIVTDSREQTPLAFPEGVETEPGSLPTGDYSIAGLEHLIAIERKSLSDLVGCIAQERSRFIRELMRLRAYRCKAIVIEGTVEDIVAHNYRSKVHHESVLGSLGAWFAKYEVPFMFCGDHAALVTVKILNGFYQTLRSLVDTIQNCSSEHHQTKGDYNGNMQGL